MSTSSKASNNTKTKVTIDGITRIVPLTPLLSWSEFEELAGQLFNHPNKSFSATYYDSDGDLIAIDRQEEFEEYLENSIGSKLLLKVGQDKDNIDWTVVKQADELSITSPSQTEQDEEDENENEHPKASVDPVSSSLLQRFFPNYQSHKSTTDNDQQDQLFQEILQRSQKALLELETPSNTSAHSRDNSELPSLNTSEHSVPQKFYLDNVRDINQPTQSQSSKLNPSEDELFIEDTHTSPQFPPSQPIPDFSYNLNSDNVNFSLENDSSNNTTISPLHSNPDLQTNNSFPEAPLQTLECSLPRNFKPSSSYQPETEAHQLHSPRLTSSLDDYPITVSVQYIDDDSESVPEEELSSLRSTIPAEDTVSNPFLDVIEEDEEQFSSVSTSSNNQSVNIPEHKPTVCFPPYSDFSNESKLVVIEEEQTNSVPSLIDICPPHPDFVVNEVQPNNRSEEEQDLPQSPQSYIAICPPHPSVFQQEHNLPENNEHLSEESPRDIDIENDSLKSQQEKESLANNSIPPPPFPHCILQRAIPSPQEDSNQAHVKPQNNELNHVNEEQPIHDNINTSNDHSSDRALENITKVSRLFDLYRSCIPNDIHVTTVVDILIDQIVSGVQLDTNVLEVSLQNISGQVYNQSNTPQRAFMDSLNSIFRHFGTSLNQFMDQFNNHLDTNTNSSNSDQNCNTHNTNPDEPVNNESTQETSEAPSIPFPNVPQHQPSNSPPHYPSPPCTRNEPIHWPNAPHQFPPLHRPPFHRPPHIPHHHHHHSHPPPPPPPHQPGSHPHPPPPSHGLGPHPQLPGSFPQPHFPHHYRHHFNHHSKSHHHRSSNDTNENNDSTSTDLSSPEHLRRHRCHKKHRNYRQHRNTSSDSSQTENKSEAQSSSAVNIDQSTSNENKRDALFPMREELKNNQHPIEGQVESDNEIEEVSIPPRRPHTYSYSQSELKAHNTQDDTQVKDNNYAHENYHKILNQLRILNDMGFHNDRLNRQLLEEFEGDLQQTVNHLLITGNIPE